MYQLQDTSISNRHKSARCRNLTVALGLFIAFVSILQISKSAQAATDIRKVFAFEYTTESSQTITFVNHSGQSQDVTVKIYEPGGSAWSGGVQTVSLAGFQTKTIIPKDDWGLAKKSGGSSGHGTPSTDTAYGIVTTAPFEYSVITYTDEQEHGGSGYSAIYAQDAYSSSVWGMWNYNGSDDKKDYFFLFNPNDTTATVTVQLRKSDGTSISSTNINVGAKATVKIYPAVDLSSNPGSNHNIGVFLSSTQPIHVSVYTQLGNDWKYDQTPPYWNSHDNVTGVFVPFVSSCNRSDYVWVNSDSTMAAARVTNPNNFAITVTEEWWFFNGSGTPNVNSDTTTTTIPAKGTAELDGYDLDLPSDSSPLHHWRRLSAVQQGTQNPADFHAHVSYFEQIDLPSYPQNEWFWGNFAPGNTDNVFLVNPTNSNITVKIQRWKNGSTTPIAGSQDIVLTPRIGLMVALPSEGAPPPGYGTSPIISDGDSNGDSAPDQTWRFYSDDPFVLHIQDWSYGDLLPSACGSGDSIYKLDWGDAPDESIGTGTGNYNTQRNDDGPRHIIFAENLRIGPRIDGEIDGQQSIGAVADQNNGLVPNDEDGVVDPSDFLLLPSNGGNRDVDVSVFNYSGQIATLACWIDFDGDGVFEVSERQMATAAHGFSGIKTLTFSVPSNIVNYTYARCRISTDASAVSGAIVHSPSDISRLAGVELPTGFAPDGEVEDYPATSDSTLAVTLQNVKANSNGDIVNVTWETATESGVAGFNIYAGLSGDPVQVNEELIASPVIDSITTTSYSYDAEVGSSEFYLEMVSINGATQTFGPFTVQTSQPAVWLPFVIN